jgi:hypothetical protein
VAVQDQAIGKNYFKNTIFLAEFGSNLAVNSGYVRSMKTFWQHQDVQFW